tara:strand:- start:1022 stop:1429 length:408 start_codon:yes stop_codon:yes gene_type:complete
MSKNLSTLQIQHTVLIFLKSQGAESGPPLGTILGNLGVSAANFCKEFNSYTNGLPTYFNLKVKIFIYENRSFSFEISSPSTGSILKLLRFQKKIQVKSFDRSLQKDILCVKLKDLISLALFKFPYLDLKSSFPVI